MAWLRLFNMIPCDIRLLRYTPGISDTQENHPFILTSLAINSMPTSVVCSYHIIIGFLINVQVQGHHPHQWAPFQVTG